MLPIMLPNMGRNIYSPKQTTLMNSTSIKSVFAKYKEVGFLYPAKQKLLSPHFQQITEHWETLSASKERLLWVLSSNEQKQTKHFASISVWKSSNFGCFAQHLVSTGNPYLSLKVMLEAQLIGEYQFSENEIRSSQNWFRPNNRYAYRIFASMYNKLGPEKAGLIHHQYLHFPLASLPQQTSSHYRIEVVESVDQEFLQFVQRQYGQVFVRAEELDQEDIQQQQHAQLFQQYRLSFSRRVWKVRDQHTGQICASLIANRAPLGLNFSFLENRAYYILDKALEAPLRAAVLTTLNNTLLDVYRDIPLQMVPIVTDQATAEALVAQGGIKIREYIQSIWLREGFRQWYEHIDSFLQRIERRKRH